MLCRGLVGLPISRAWRGYGSALFLDLGDLLPVEPSPTADPRERGEASITVEWSWRVERARSIEVGSWSTEARIDTGVARLAGPRVIALSVEGRLPELVFSLSDRRWVRSFMTAEGQAQWTVFLLDKCWLTVERGCIVHDTQNQVSL